MNLEALFGGKTATQALLYIARYSEATSTEIAACFEVPKPQVFIQLKRLCAAQVLSVRKVSSVSLYSFNPRSGVRDELKAMLEKYIKDQMPKAEYPKFYLVRRRERADGKKLGGVYED